jgi:IS30 family transposase
MHQKGIRQSDIARQLGKSRQTVFRNLKRTKELLTQLEESREQHSQRAASETAQGQSTLTTLVATLAEEGFTQSEIANIVDAPKDLILSALRWVKDHPPPVSKKP